MQPAEFRTGHIRPIECAKEAWETIKPNYWLFFAICLLGIWLSGITLYVLLGAMVCGIFYSFLTAIDGSQPVFTNLWKGFKFFTPGFVVMLFFVVPLLVVYAIMYGPIFYAVYANPGMSEQELIALISGGTLIDTILVIGMVCFHTLLLFAFPLVIDRGFGPLKAVLTSARAVWANLSGVTGLIGVQFVLTLIGGLLLCFGIYLVIPIIFATNAVAYRKVFPAMPTPHLNPPPPNAYSVLQ
jgi:hypothetical protein